MPTSKLETTTPKKTTRRRRKPQSQKSVVTDTVTQSQFVKTQSKSNKSFKLIAIALALVVLAILGLRFRYLVVPGTVNGKPIFIWQYISRLHASAGPDVLDQLMTELLINQEADKAGITVSREDLDKELAEIQLQFGDAESFEAFIVSQGLTKKEVEEQITLNTKLKRLMKDNIAVTDEEVNTEYAENSDLYEDLSEEEAKEQIRQGLSDQKTQTEVSNWIQEARTNSQLNVLIP